MKYKHKHKYMYCMSCGYKRKYIGTRKCPKCGGTVWMLNPKRYIENEEPKQQEKVEEKYTLRRVQKSSLASLSITLPKPWTEENNIQPQDFIKVEKYGENQLLLTKLEMIKNE